MTEIQTVRASALPIAFRCAASLRPEGQRINATNDAAADGTAAHECLRGLVDGGGIEWDRIQEVAQHHGADAEQVRILVAQGLNLWIQVRDSFPQAISEVALSLEVGDVLLTGHVDLVSHTSPRVARIGDWKTGRKDTDCAHQMKAYMVMVLADDLELDEVTATVLWVREQEIENYRMTREDARAWLGLLRSEVIDWNGVYRPGNHCPHCNRRHECKAARALIASDVAVIATPEVVARTECEIELMSPEDLVEVFQRADLVIKYADRVRDAIKAHIQKTGDIVASGVRLTIATEERREVLPEKAWPILEAEGFSDPDFASVMKLSASKIEKLVATRAGKGKGAGAVRDIKAKLEAAGAIEKNEIHKLQVKRA